MAREFGDKVGEDGMTVDRFLGRYKIRDDGTQLNCEINHRDRTFPASLSPPAAVSAQRWHHQNPKFP
jgi:hypothetical protein